MTSLGNPSTTGPRRWRRGLGRGLLSGTLALATGVSLAGLAMAPAAAPAPGGHTVTVGRTSRRSAKRAAGPSKAAEETPAG